MSVPQHLHRVGSIYYLRLRIPADLTRHYQKSHIKQSLRTGDLKMAKERLTASLAKHYLEFENLRTRSSRSALGYPQRKVMDLDDDMIERICASFSQQLLDDDRELRFEALIHGMPISERKSQNDRDQQTLDGLQEILLGSTPLNAIDPALSQALAFTGIELDSNVSHESFQRLRYSFIHHLIKVGNAKLQRASGQVINTDEVIQKSAVLPTKVISAKAAYKEIFELWKHAEQGRPARTVDAYELSWNEFSRQVKYKPVKALEHVDVLGYRDALTKSKAAHATIKKKVGQVKTLLAVATEYAFIPANPASAVKVKKPKVGRQSRQSFSIEDLNKIFQSPLYTGGKIPKAGSGSAALWLPILALFTGARLEELGQLQVGDVFETSGIPVLDITDMPDEAGAERC